MLEEGEWFITTGEEFHRDVELVARQIADLRASENSVFLVARRHRQVVGFLTIQGGALRRMRHVGKLEVMVRSDQRGQGVGAQLLDAAIAWAEDAAMLTKLGLSVFATNTRALALYESRGFEVEGRREDEYRMADGSYRADVLLFRRV